jgi:hypothetical protein
LSIPCMAQQSSTPEPKAERTRCIKLSDIQLMMTVAPYQHGTGSLSQFRALAPESQLLQRDLESLTPTGGYWAYSYGPSKGFLVGFDIHGEKLKNAQLRIGASLLSMPSISNSYWRHESHIVDTLVSPTSGAMVFQDSTVTEQYSATYSADALELNASLVLRTRQNRHFGLYGGMGLAFGVGFGSNLYTHHSVMAAESYISEADTNGFIRSFSNNYIQLEQEFEQYKVRPEITWAAYVPLGVDFRLSKKDVHLSKVHLFTELRPTLRGRNAEVFGHFMQATVSGSAGLRVQFH